MAKKVTYTFEEEKFELNLKDSEAEKLKHTVENSSVGHLYKDFKISELDSPDEYEKAEEDIED